jgi:hypothetical protein
VTSPRSCSVVAGIGCDVPANVLRGVIEDRAKLLAKCYQCGQDVCRDADCSQLTKLPPNMSAPGVRQVRLCANCVAQNAR